MCACLTLLNDFNYKFCFELTQKLYTLFGPFPFPLALREKLFKRLYCLNK